MTEGLLLESHLAEFRIALHQVSHYQEHLGDELPVLVLLLTGLLLLRAVLVPALIDLAVFLHPFECSLVLLLVVDALVHAPENLGLVHLLIAHSKVFLPHVRVHDAAGDSH